MKNFKLYFLSLILVSQLNAFEEFLVSDIRIIGLQRVSTGSIFNVIPISVGDKIDLRKSTDITKSLFSTEQFDDIQIAKDGNTLIISVVERPSISAIDISGNKALKTEQLIESLDGVGIKEGEVYKRSTLEKVRSELVRSYSSNGRYGANVEIDEVRQSRNRIDINITIDENHFIYQDKSPFGVTFLNTLVEFKALILSLNLPGVNVLPNLSFISLPVIYKNFFHN